jgi:hypothetical protein
MEIKVIVSQEDIAKGVKRDPDNCPIACAIKRMGYTDVSVAALGVYFWSGDTYYSLALPQEATIFITRFDKDFSVAPFSFNLEK